MLEELKKELLNNAHAGYKTSAQKFFKEPVLSYGVRVGIVRNIARRFFPKTASKKEIFILCEALLKTEIQEDSIIAYQWVSRMQKQWDKKDFVLFESWLKKYVNNWAKCDDLCTGPLGDFFAMYPSYIPKTRTWRTSKNRWVRRASAVVLIIPMKRSEILDEVFSVVDALLQDEDDMVRKGYGWLLKESSKKYKKDILEYVIKNKKDMPRVSLRYAIEHMTVEEKKRAME